jgi:hypothetical protein
MTLPAAAAHAADGWTFGAGGDYSTGDYGSDTTTTIWSVPFSARYTSGAWTFKATLPWLRVDGDVNVLPGLGNVGNSNPNGRGKGRGNGGAPQPTPEPTDAGSASGLGDLRVAATYAFDTGTPLGIDLTANVKIATADEDKGLGTGANDYGLLLDLYRDLDGTTVFGGVGYQILGDTDYVETKDVFGANVGAQHAWGPGTFGVVYDWRGAASHTADPRSELTGFYSVRSSDATKWQFYATKGLSDGSPEWGGGIFVTHAF